MQGLQRLKRMDNYRGSERTYRNAMAYMFASNPDKHLANVFLEDEFCIACNFKVRLFEDGWQSLSGRQSTRHSRPLLL